MQSRVCLWKKLETLDQNGFTGKFYKACWNIIKEDIMLALSAIQHGRVSFQIAQHITLLPKEIRCSTGFQAYKSDS